MKVQLTKDRQIKGALRKTGESVIVNKDEGERLIAKGLANRLIAPPENRIRGVPDNRQHFTPFTRFGR